MEERCKKITALISEAKNKNKTSRSQISSMITDDKKNELEDEIRSLEESKKHEEKKYKS